MTVTKIEVLDKKRYKIFIDEELAFVLYKGELRRFGIVEGQELAKDIYSEIIDEHLPKRAYNRCLHLLEKRSYTSNQLRSKLGQGYYPSKAIEYGIARCEHYGYIDDEDYVRRYIDCYGERKNRKQLLRELIKRGISKDLFERIYDEADVGCDEKELILRLLQKRHYLDHLAEAPDRNAIAKEKNKQFSYLFGKGFSPEHIRSALDITSY